jgi:ATP-dependent Clp protease protease subunit
MVGDLEKSSFSNIEQQSLEFVKYTLDPWVVRWEQALQQALLLPSEKLAVTIRFNLDGTIAEESWFDDDITPQLFKSELMAADGDVTIWLNSPGGDCVAASQIYAMLMDYKGNVMVKIDGIAASAASVIAMAGTKVLMAPTALMMIHNPLTIAIEDSDEMKKAVEMLNEVKESIINAYEIKTGQARVKISH